MRNILLMKNKLKRDLKDLRTDILYINSYQSSVILVITSTLMVFLFHDALKQFDVYSGIIFIWYPYAIAAFLLKIILTAVYHKKKIKNKNNWRKIFYLTTAITGMVFGSYLFFLRSIDNQTYIYFTILLLGALTSGSVSTHSTSLTAFAIFNMLSLFPYSIYFILSSNKDYAPVGLLILMFLVTIFFTAYRINRILTNSLNLSIDNDSIIEKLSQSEEKFSKSFYSGIAPMAMLSFENATFIDANNAMLNLIKHTREEIIGKTPYDLELYQKPEDAIDLIVEAYNTKHLSNREITLTTGNGNIIHCLVTVENFRVNDDTIALVMLQDFTGRIENEKQLKIERDRAESAASAKTRFLAVMSHEIRTPMNSILGMTNLAMVTENADERNEYLSVVKDAGKYLLVLINDILDMSKIEAGKVRIELIDTDLNKFVTSVYHTLELLILSKKLTFRKTLMPDLPQYIKTSPDRLRQVLINLIGNAFKFTNEGEISIRVSLSDGEGYKYISGGTEFIEFSVSDTGIGIPPEKQELIFDSFTQGDESTFRKFGGTGLGLTICKQVIKMMKGDIKVLSEPGKGSTFSFIIPLLLGDKSRIDNADPYANLKRKELMNILIAEDNIMNRRLIEAYMKKLGHNFVIAENGIDAIEKLKQNRFDMVLMDLEMPVMDGYEAMKRIRSGEAGDENSDVIIYAMSAHVLKETINKCIDDGFSGYIIKPLDLKRLKDIL